MFRFCVFLFTLVCILLRPANSQDRLITLATTPELAQSGALKFILPRFTLKHSIRFDLIELEDKAAIPIGTDVVWIADNSLTASHAVMHWDNAVYFVSSTHTKGDTTELATRSGVFVDWLLSDIGMRTLLSFKVDGVGVFTAPPKEIDIVIAPVFTGDIASGKKLAYDNCGRCHVIGTDNRMKGLGSSPSFALMRTFPDWHVRFEGFFALNPHPSFTQITSVTTPFNAALPPPIHPLEISLDDLADILAFVATIKPADLGAPLQHQ